MLSRNKQKHKNRHRNHSNQFTHGIYLAMSNWYYNHQKSSCFFVKTMNACNELLNLPFGHTQQWTIWMWSTIFIDFIFIHPLVYQLYYQQLWRCAYSMTSMIAVLVKLANFWFDLKCFELWYWIVSLKVRHD